MTGPEARWVDGQLTYQYRKLAHAMKYVPENRRRVAIDIGAHVGMWTMQMAKMFEHVHAFEPNEETSRLFPWNVKSDNVTLHKLALGKGEGRCDIKQVTNSSGNCISVVGDSIRMAPLDSFNFDSVDFIKIDTEGYEAPIIKGAIKTILSNRPVMVVEQKGFDATRGMKKDGGLRLLLELGMKSEFCIGGDHILTWNR